MMSNRLFPTEHPILYAGGGVFLRELTEDDLPWVVKQCQDPLVIKYTLAPLNYDINAASAWLSRTQEGWDDGSFASFVIDYEGAYAGSCHLAFKPSREASIGYALGPWARGKGISKLAIRALVDWGFSVGAEKITWEAAEGNEASWAVARSAGFVRTGNTVIKQRGENVQAWKGELLRQS